jgi:hypothetical protein
MTMKQIIIVGVLTLLLSAFFVDQAFAQAKGGIAGNGTNAGVGGNGGVGTSGGTANGKHGTDASGQVGGNTTGDTGEED